MPDKDGKFTSDDKAKIIQWLTEKGAGKPEICPVCGNDHWVVGDHMVSMVVHSGINMMLGGISYPQCFVYCTKCFYTRNFMAGPIGLVARVEPPAEAKENKGIPEPAGVSNANE